MSISCNEIEIVGFNGAPLVECGRRLPVARRKSDEMHCVLTLPAEGQRLSWYGEEEAASHAENKQWTMFDKAVSVPRSCQQPDGQLMRQPMVIFANEVMLDTADRLPRPPLISGEYLIWQKLKGYSELVQAACSSAGAVEAQLNDWGSALLVRFDAMYRLGRELEYLKRIADFALCAATERTLRWKSYLRYAAAQNLDHVGRTFDTFTQSEFPDVSWEEFAKERARLIDLFGTVTPVRTVQPAPASSSPSTALPKVRDIATKKPIDEGLLLCQ